MTPISMSAEGSQPRLVALGRGVVEQHSVPPEESFCLALLRTGVVGYTAYVCPRPAGPELDTGHTGELDAA